MRIPSIFEINVVAGGVDLPVIVGGILGGLTSAVGFWAVLAITEPLVLGSPFARNVLLPMIQGTPVFLVGTLTILTGTQIGCYLADNYWNTNR